MRLLLTFALTLLFSLTTLAAGPDFVNGHIYDTNGQPLAGVTLAFQSSQVTRVFTTNAAGFYHFTATPVPFPFDPTFTLVPALANYSFSPTFAVIYVIPGGTASQQNFTGTLGSLTTSPLDTPEFFVRQQYVDLLKREPDESGLNFWSGGLRACTTQACRNTERRNVMCAFIASGDYQARFVGSSITVCQ